MEAFCVQASAAGSYTQSWPVTEPQSELMQPPTTYTFPSWTAAAAPARLTGADARALQAPVAGSYVSTAVGAEPDGGAPPMT
jgi:hypothetical protein